MAGPQLRLVTLLLLLVAVVCSASVAAEAALPAEARLLRQQTDESEAVTTEAAASSHSSYSGSSSSSGSLDAGATISDASAAESHKTEHEGPSTMSFVGPALAGVLAIVLIGAVVTFKNRMGK
ncbi:putative secreted RxLR effector protein [Phytophthora cinnamomi]|uniref:putative secreted RxLR effector protein n=1 Tax=Phytophthora cinnamomi TaxID=4785 RepID=UPI00355A3B72|nr:putative secreted RxLR effector protein [Phytophthora cinnamomi]